MRPFLKNMVAGPLAALLLTCGLGTGGLTTPAMAQVGGQGLPAGIGTQIQQALLSNIQQQVGFSDEEFTVIGPKLWNIVRLQVDSGAGGIGSLVGSMRGLGRGGRGGGGRGPGNIIAQIFNNGQPSLVDSKRQELQTALDNPDTTTQQLTLKMQEFRAAVQKTRTDLAAAQKDLVALLTIRQEAVLVQLGMLD